MTDAGQPGLCERRRMMLRRLAAIASLAVLAALFLGATGAQALIAPPTDWAVSVSGKQTLKWSFDAEIPEACEAYYGTASQKASGSGAISMAFKSKKPIPAQTTLAGTGVKFSSFNVSGSYTAPGSITKSGKFSVINGRPCGWVDGDLEPLPKIADNRDCGTEKAKVGVALSWAAGKFGLGAGFGMLPWGACPGPIVSDMRVLQTTSGCKPNPGEDAIYGETLAGIPAPVPASKFIARKKFSVDASQEF
ncbi:MAG: hypothetical protein JST59_25845, partial [Actinobacteria bacterium]|nr:hypothetical protein [Actinomycetota bacterium]